MCDRSGEKERETRRLKKEIRYLTGLPAAGPFLSSCGKDRCRAGSSVTGASGNHSGSSPCTTIIQRKKVPPPISCTERSLDQGQSPGPFPCRKELHRENQDTVRSGPVRVPRSRTLPGICRPRRAFPCEGSPCSPQPPFWYMNCSIRRIWIQTYDHPPNVFSCVPQRLLWALLFI